jgi:hypothetical protein
METLLIVVLVVFLLDSRGRGILLLAQELEPS